MNFTFSTQKTTLTDSKKAIATELLSKFDKFFDKEPSCKLLFSKEGNDDNNISVEAAITAGKNTYRAAASNKTFEAAVNDVYEKLKKQIRREKDKMISSTHDTIRVEAAKSEEISKED